MATKDRVELGPFYSKRPLPEQQGTEWSLLWPFLDGYAGETGRQAGFRPLLNIRRESREEPDGNVSEVQALWPLVLYRKTEGPKQKVIRLFPVFYHRDFHHPDGRKETDTAFYPFFLTGRSSDSDENYFSIFPIAGTVKGLFAKDRIRFLLFPLYADSVEGEHRSWHFLWPFVQYSRGGGRHSFRVWPLVGWKAKEGRYQRSFILWPFFAHSRERLGSEHPLDSWFFLPFYARQQTAFGKIQYFLYPFVSYQRSDRPGNRFREWNVPWPLVSIARGDRYRKTYLWPFWGRQQRGTYSRDFLAYPLYWHSEYRNPAWVNERRYLLPFYWSWYLRDEKAQRERGLTKVWPLLSRTRAEGGEEEWNVLSPLWFRDPDGFERNFGPLWTFYRYRRSSLGGTEHRLFWYGWSDPGSPHLDEETRSGRDADFMESGTGEKEDPEDDENSRNPMGRDRIREFLQNLTGEAFP